MQVTHQSPAYAAKDVFESWVRCQGSRRDGYRFRVQETSRQGNTLREYITDGSEFTGEFQVELIKRKTTLKWDRQ